MKVYDTLSQDDIASNIEIYKDDLLNEKVLFFNTVELSHEEIADFLPLLDQQCTDRRVEYLNNQQHEGLLRAPSSITVDEQEDFVFRNWHCDNSLAENPHCQIPVIISMRMDTLKCDRDLSKTLFVDTKKMLDNAPRDLVDWMKGTYFIDLMGYENEGKIPYVSNDDLVKPLRAFPSIMTHEVTGFNHFVLMSQKYSFFPENKTMEEKYRLYVKDYLSDYNNMDIITWNEGSLVVWDNRSVIHSFQAGWQDDERIFTRYQFGFTLPFYRPEESM